MILGSETLVIRRNDLQSAGGRMASLALAVGYWGWLAYLLNISVLIAGWGTAWGLTNLVVSHTSFAVMLNQSAGAFLPLILGMIMLFWGWGFYNWLRFNGAGDRRCRAKDSPLDIEDTSETCSLNVSDLENLQRGRLNVCHFDDRGNICAVECLTKLS